jgi:hypothetical protein
LEEGVSEIVVFGDSRAKEELIKEFQSSNVKINKTSFSVGMPLRVTFEGSPSKPFEIALKMWKANKRNISVTYRINKVKTLELNDSSVSEIEGIIARGQ